MDRITVWMQRGGKGYGVCIVTAIILVIAASIMKYNSGNINYYNSDATWHTLLIVEAYSETPVSQHLFLPIVTLGAENDKWIPWGATIPDDQGNYYYTSFSPAGYFLPWLFFKALRLSVCERNIYLLNSLLFALSAVLWAVFLKWIFERNEIVLLGTMLYIFSPELFHGMGIVYWHQSVLQVTLIAQIMAYYRYKDIESKACKRVFYLLAFINPYIEWTGYVANGGFILAELLFAKKEKLAEALRRIINIGILSIAAFLTFVIHYLIRVDSRMFFDALKARFMARNMTAATELSSVFGGYFKSFAYIWIVFLILIIWNVWKYKKIEIPHGMILLVLAFPLLENMIMKQHAVTYSYDRMKGILFLSFLCCELMRQLMDETETKKYIFGILICVVALSCIMNLRLYKNGEYYMWDAGYRADNMALAEYINDKYPNSVLGVSEGPVRGYVNLLFGRGIYEGGVDSDILCQMALEKELQYAVVLNIEDFESWNMYEFGGATIYDVYGNIIKDIEVDGGIIQENYLYRE